VSENLLRVLELLLLALVYLFFLRVLRAVWAEVRPPAARPSRGGATAAAPVPVAPRREARRSTRLAHPSALVVSAPAEHKGRRYGLGEVLTLGRAPANQVVVDDTYVSQVHARVFTRDGEVFVEDLGSTNGTWVNRHRITGPTPLRKGDQVQVGTTVLEAV